MPDLPSGTVTFLFTDLEGSTQLWERQPEVMRGALARHDSLLRQAVEKHRGHVFKTGGDAFCVAFQSASEALAAALEAQLALHAEDRGQATPLRARATLHAGAADLRDGDYFGPALNRAARLLAIAHGGQTLISQTVYDLVRDALPEGAALRDLGAHRLKDLQRPERVHQLLHPGLPDEFPPLRSLEALPNNLPLQPTSFIGRERELTELRDLLPANRLLTLTGAGGSGKTRLALQLAAELVEAYPDGVWLVDLASLTDPALVPQTVAAALGVREVPGRFLTLTLSEHLKSRRLLLLLDNCEHLVEACAHLAGALMRASSGLTLLATSREVFGIGGEAVWSIPALSSPDPRGLAHPTPAAVAGFTQYEAVRLFIDRARLAKPGFTITDQNAPAVAQICHRLDGIPLAIELAAGKVKALSPEQIAARLDDRFRLLTGGSRIALPRHQTLRAAIDWSYELLSEPERVLLRRLSAFAGGWTLEAAEAICAGQPVDEHDVLEILTRLVDKSLVIAETDARGGTRYRLLGTVRQYGGERLGQAGESASVRSRHRDWFLALAERAAPELTGREQALWLDRLEQEHDNLRAALEWSLAEEAGAEPGLRLAGFLFRFWSVRGYVTEGQTWLEAALARSAGTSPAARARALRGLGALATQQNDLQKSADALDQSLALYRRLDDKRGLARALTGRGNVEIQRGEAALAERFYQEALEPARTTELWDLVATVLNNLGEVARLRGDYTAARASYEEALLAAGEASARSRTHALANLGLVALFEGDCAAARARAVEGIAIAARLGDRRMVAAGLEVLAGVLAREGQAERAARLLGAADGLRRAINAPLELADSPEYDRTVATARAVLDEAAFAALHAEGETMTMEQAIAHALEKAENAAAALETRDHA